MMHCIECMTADVAKQWREDNQRIQSGRFSWGMLSSRLLTAALCQLEHRLMQETILLLWEILSDETEDLIERLDWYRQTWFQLFWLSEHKFWNLFIFFVLICILRNSNKNNCWIAAKSAMEIRIKTIVDANWSQIKLNLLSRILAILLSVHIVLGWRAKKVAAVILYVWDVQRHELAIKAEKERKKQLT